MQRVGSKDIALAASSFSTSTQSKRKPGRNHLQLPEGDWHRARSAVPESQQAEATEKRGRPLETLQAPRARAGAIRTSPEVGGAKAGESTRETLIVETATALNDFPEPVARYDYLGELANDPSNYWAPNTRCLELMLREIGFPQAEIFLHPMAPADRHVVIARR